MKKLMRSTNEWGRIFHTEGFENSCRTNRITLRSFLKLVRAFIKEKKEV